MIYHNYGEVLMGAIIRIVKRKDFAEDVFQEALVKMWKKSETYDASKGKLFTWMFNICRNTAIDKTRSKHYKQSTNIQSDDSVVFNTESGTSYEMKIDPIGLKDWVNKLDVKHQEAIDIVYFKGYSHREAAKELDLPVGTLKTRIRTAINELRKIVVD